MSRLACRLCSQQYCSVLWASLVPQRMADAGLVARGFGLAVQRGFVGFGLRSERDAAVREVGTLGAGMPPCGRAAGTLNACMPHCQLLAALAVPV